MKGLLGQKSLYTNTHTYVYLENKNRNYGGSSEEGDGSLSLASKTDLVEKWEKEVMQEIPVLLPGLGCDHQQR